MKAFIRPANDRSLLVKATEVTSLEMLVGVLRGKRARISAECVEFEYTLLIEVDDDASFATLESA